MQCATASAPGQLQALKGLRAGHFMYQMAVDIDQCSAIGFLPDHMGIPEFVVKCLRIHIVSRKLRFGTRNYAITMNRQCSGENP